jgi:putative hemin transport protein
MTISVDVMSSVVGYDGQSTNLADLRQAFRKARDSGKRAKDAADFIGISEGLAVAAHCGGNEAGPKATQLKQSWIELLKALQFCGPLMALTRNENVVHEKTGVYEKISSESHMGLALGADIDLRIFLSEWHAGFAVTEMAANPHNQKNMSLQFFDKYGKAVHKIFPREGTDLQAWNSIAESYAATIEDSDVQFLPAPPRVQRLPNQLLNSDALLADWAAMQDTHEFFGLLRKHNVERQECFRSVEGRFSHQLTNEAVRSLLLEAAFEQLPIMVFVSSGGCIQIHTGPVQRIEPMEIRGTTWLNVLDPTFNLHLKESSISNVWLVEKPTTDGVVTSVEAFDNSGDLMAMFFGARKPGKPELQGWREITKKLARLNAS